MNDLILQLVIWITGIASLGTLQWINTRKANKKQANADADKAVFGGLREYNEFLQEQLHTKEERFADQTALVRKLQSEVLNLTQEIAELRLELSMKRCDDDFCPFRQPPNANTPPKPGITKEEYHANKDRQ